MKRVISLVLALSFLALIAMPAAADSFVFSTGAPTDAMAMASRPDSAGRIEIEAADDFVLTNPTSLTTASFTGLLPQNAQTSSINQVVVEIYRVFPADSDTNRTPNVPTRTNSPSDVAFATRNSNPGGGLSFTAAITAASFTAQNSVLNGINKSPNQNTKGEGPVTGEEAVFAVNFTTPLDLPAGHYFFIPQVELASGDFFWLSGQRPIVFPPGNTDLQTWIRNENIDPDWLRVGTDIVGGNPAPTFNGAFTLSGTEVPLPGALPLLGTGLAGLLLWRCRKPS